MLLIFNSAGNGLQRGLVIEYSASHLLFKYGQGQEWLKAVTSCWVAWVTSVDGGCQSRFNGVASLAPNHNAQKYLLSCLLDGSASQGKRWTNVEQKLHSWQCCEHPKLQNRLASECNACYKCSSFHILWGFVARSEKAQRNGWIGLEGQWYEKSGSKAVVRNKAVASHCPRTKHFCMTTLGFFPKRSFHTDSPWIWLLYGGHKSWLCSHFLLVEDEGRVTHKIRTCISPALAQDLLIPVAACQRPPPCPAICQTLLCPLSTVLTQHSPSHHMLSFCTGCTGFTACKGHQHIWIRSCRIRKHFVKCLTTKRIPQFFKLKLPQPRLSSLNAKVLSDVTAWGIIVARGLLIWQ